MLKICGKGPGVTDNYGVFNRITVFYCNTRKTTDLVCKFENVRQ